MKVTDEGDVSMGTAVVFPWQQLDLLWSGSCRLTGSRHGHHHLHQDDHAGHPEPVWLRGGGEPGCSQGPPGPLQGGGRTQRRTCSCPPQQGVSNLSSCPAFCPWQNGQTPLMLAAEQGSLEVLQELIRRGANVNLDDVVRQAPLTHHHSPPLICFHGHKVSWCVCVRTAGLL